MERVNEFNRREGLPVVEMGIAIHTGEVVVGNIGSDKRAKYGVVGSPVNLTARIESYTVGGQILVSDRTRREGGADLSVGSRGRRPDEGLREAGLRVGRPGRRRGTSTSSSPPARSRSSRCAGRSRSGSRRSPAQRVDGPESEGLLVRLSMKEAEIETRERPEAFRNLRLRFVGRDGSTIAGEVYGKVSTPKLTTKGFGLRFTSRPARDPVIPRDGPGREPVTKAQPGERNDSTLPRRRGSSTGFVS